MKNGQRILSLALCGLVLAGCPKLGAFAPEGSGGLVITILDGEGALNDVRQRTAREPIIEVDDENHRPVAGAAVLFLLPKSGPGGSFQDGAMKLSTVTDNAGRAEAKGFQPNSIAGPFEILVVVTLAGQTSRAIIHQKNTNVATQPEGRSTENPNGVTQPEGRSTENPNGVTRPEGRSTENPNGATHPEGRSTGGHTLTLKVILLSAEMAAVATGIAIVARGGGTVISPGSPSVGPPSAGIVGGSVRIPLHAKGH